MNDPDSATRFEFGENWSRFLSLVDDARIATARNALIDLLGDQRTVGSRFLDVGSGSGIVSLAARQLGMTVVSFDFDSKSVACTRALAHRYYPNDPGWVVMQGSILDSAFVCQLGKFDVVYAWGVLHHTGAMWKAIDVVGNLVRAGGLLAIAIYNDQRHWSKVWRFLKLIYNKMPRRLRKPYAILVMLPREIKIALVPIIKLKPMAYFAQWGDTSYDHRGMSRWHDLLDWVGGFPFEVATPEQVFDFHRQRGFQLRRLKTCGGELGCNEFVFVRDTVGTKQQSTDCAGLKLRDEVGSESVINP